MTDHPSYGSLVYQAAPFVQANNLLFVLFCSPPLPLPLPSPSWSLLFWFTPFSSLSSLSPMHISFGFCFVSVAQWQNQFQGYVWDAQAHVSSVRPGEEVPCTGCLQGRGPPSDQRCVCTVGVFSLFSLSLFLLRCLTEAAIVILVAGSGSRVLDWGGPIHREAGTD